MNELKIALIGQNNLVLFKLHFQKGYFFYETDTKLIIFPFNGSFGVAILGDLPPPPPTNQHHHNRDTGHPHIHSKFVNPLLFYLMVSLKAVQFKLYRSSMC